MCTASWARNSECVQFFFNRDERHSRKPGEAPQIATSRDVNFISPIDGDFGGTWIGVNEYACIFALLNFYPNPAPPLPANKISRGFIIPKIAFTTNKQECSSEIQRLELNRYEPFEFLFLDAQLDGFIARWDGSNLTFRTDLASELPLSSSSFVTSEIVHYRRGFFRTLRDSATFDSDVELQEYFHFACPQSDKAWNPLMWREEARTVSISRITIDTNGIRFTYIPIENDQKISHQISEVELSRKS